MAQVWIEIEENDNCGYFPTQVFELRGETAVGQLAFVELGGGGSGGNDGSDVPSGATHEVVGWHDGRRSEVRAAPVGDSGAGESVLVYGGDNGIRLRPTGSEHPWELTDAAKAAGQYGEPYLLLAAGAVVRMVAEVG